MNMTRAQRDTLPEPEPKTQRLQTMPNGVVVARRRFYEAATGDIKTWVVAPDMGRALAILSDLDMCDVDYLAISELREESARGVRIRPTDESPANNLADAPMGSVWSTEE